MCSSQRRYPNRRSQYPSSIQSVTSSTLTVRLFVFSLVAMTCLTTANDHRWLPEELTSSSADEDGSPVFTEDDVNRIRRLLSLAYDLERTPIGSLILRPAHEAGLIQAALLDMVEKVRSLDIDSLADLVLAEDETMLSVISLLQMAEEEAANDGLVVDRPSPSTLDGISTLLDLPWIPSANLSECSQAYSQFVDPITNRVWAIVRDRVCSQFPVGCAILGIPPVPTTPQPSWGRRMIDAMGKIPEGISEGKLHFVGSYDMCNAFEIENVTLLSRTDLIRFNGQYCRLNLLSNFSGLESITEKPQIPLQLGVCTPGICSRQEVINYITVDNKLLALILRLVLDNVTIPSVYCDMELDASSDAALKASVSIMLIFVILIVISTVYDGCFRKWRLRRYLKKLPTMKRHKRNGNNKKESTNCSTKSTAPIASQVSIKSDGDDSVMATVDNGDDGRVSSYELLEETGGRLGLVHRLELLLIGFSAYTNLRKVFSTRSKPGDIPVLNGVRYLSYVWVILGQTYLFGPVYHESFVTANTWTFLRTAPHEFKMQAVINFTIAGDSFLLISGILVTYWFLKRFEESGRKFRIISIVIYAVRRYWRVMPGVVLTLMFYTTTYRYLAEGPLFPANIGDGDNCRLNWWVNLLMVQNLVRTEYLCLAWLFLVPIIFQLQLAAIVVLIPLVLKPVFGYVMVAVMWIAHIITTAILSHEYRTNDDIADIATGYLFTPWCRAGPFCVGLALGIVLYEKRKIKMHWAVVLLGWIVALGTMAAVVFSSYSEFREGGERWSSSALTAYDTLARSAWGIAVGWVIFACHHGYGGVINTFLSWKLFLPLSRLVYASLLTHGIMVFRYIYTNRQLHYIEEYHQLYLILSNIVYTLFMGIFFGLLFHFPISLGIERAVLSRTLVDWFRAGRHPRTVERVPTDDISDSSMPSTDVFSDVFSVESHGEIKSNAPPSNVNAISNG